LIQWVAYNPVVDLSFMHAKGPHLGQDGVADGAGAKQAATAGVATGLADEGSIAQVVLDALAKLVHV
jgi:hypothetical protein